MKKTDLLTHTLLTMNRIVSRFVLPVLLLLPLDAAAGQITPEDQAVLAPIHAMFAGMTARDSAAIRKPTLPGGGMVLMRDGVPEKMSFEEFAERVGKPGRAKVEERIRDPLIRIDHDLAVVWAPFELYVDGKGQHCGTDVFNLVRQNGQWLIASVADTSRDRCTSR